MLQMIDIPGVGLSLQGCTLEQAWMSSPMKGEQMLTGQMAETIIASFQASLARTISASYKEHKFLQIDRLEDTDVWLVEAKTSNALPVQLYFSIDSGLLLAAFISVDIPMSDQKVTTKMFFYDYRTMTNSDNLHAYQVRTETMGQLQTLTLESIEVNANNQPKISIPASLKPNLEQKN